MEEDDREEKKSFYVTQASVEGSSHMVGEESFRKGARSPEYQKKQT